MTDDFHKAPKAWAQVKHSILGNYLSLLLGKLGKAGRPVFYVDGFAGPGRLEDGSEGSPLIAANLAENPRQASRRGLLHCINVEEKHDTFENLVRATEPFVRSGRVTNFEGRFHDRLQEVLDRIRDDSAFFFIDPFGTEGVEVDTVRRIASRHGKTEILVRYDDTRVKRLLSWAINNEESFDEGQRKTSQAFKNRIDRLTDASLLDVSGLPDRLDLIEGYIRKVKSTSNLRFALNFPIRNPDTKGHRYFLVHFSDFPDGYIHMANFMARVDRSVEGLDTADLFQRPQLELMAINEHLAGQKRSAMVNAVRDRLGSLWIERGWSRVQNRDLFAAIVDEFGWRVLRSEYLEALRELEQTGLVSMEGADDNQFTTFH